MLIALFWFEAVSNTYSYSSLAIFSELIKRSRNGSLKPRGVISSASFSFKELHRCRQIRSTFRGVLVQASSGSEPFDSRAASPGEAADKGAPCFDPSSQKLPLTKAHRKELKRFQPAGFF